MLKDDEDLRSKIIPPPDGFTCLSDQALMAICMLVQNGLTLKRDISLDLKNLFFFFDPNGELSVGNPPIVRDTVQVLKQIEAQGGVLKESHEFEEEEE